MYHYQTFKGADAVEFCETKLELPENFDMSAVVKVEIYSASLPEDQEDFCEARVIDAEDVVLCVRRMYSF
jgi:hypothetical protein